MPKSPAPRKFSPKPGARSARSEGRAPRKSFGDAPRKSFGDAPRKAYGDGPRKPAADGARKSYGADRPPRAGYADRPRAPRRESEGGAGYGDPYQRAERPARSFRPRTDEGGEARGDARGDARGFTVTLDPDVARVFRGDASVNKALRLVMQLTEVAAPRPRGAASARFGNSAPAVERPRRVGYQGSGEARGFERKPRFDEESDAE